MKGLADIPDIELSVDQATWANMVAQEKASSRGDRRPIVGIWNCQTHAKVDLVKDVELVQEIQTLIDQDPESSNDDDERKQDEVEGMAKQGLKLAQGSKQCVDPECKFWLFSRVLRPSRF